MSNLFEISERTSQFFSETKVQNDKYFGFLLKRIKYSIYRIYIPYIYSTDPSGNSITFDRDARSLNDIPGLKCQSKQIFTMKQYTPRERSEIVEIYIQQNKSIVKLNVLRTPLSVYTKNFRLLRLFLIRRGQIKVDQGDRPRILLPYEPVLRGPQEHPKNAVLALICICSRTKFN